MSNPGQYIPVDQKNEIDTRPLVIWSVPSSSLHKETLAANGGRSGDLVYGTLLAKVASTQKWVPFINEAATDGSAHPQGIYIGADITEADIQAGDVENLMVLISDAHIDENLLVIENAKTLDTIITVGTTDLRTVRDHLKSIGIIPRPTSISSGGAN